MPLPKSHAHPVGDPVEVSVNLTVSGRQPLVTSAVKSATCATAMVDTKTIARERPTSRRVKWSSTDFGA